MIDFVNISLQFGGKYLFKDINYKINSGDKISLVGANGTGKSSLLKIITGIISPESGKIQKQKDLTIGYLPQDNISHTGKTLLDEAKSSLTALISLQAKEEVITNQLLLDSLTVEEKEDLANQLGEVHHKLEDLDSYSAESKIEKILIGLGFDEADFSRNTSEFSGGWQMRIALAKILIAQNDVLLLDEPTNHLDLDSLNWLVSFLKSYNGALLIVSHDKHFINSVTNRTLEIYLSRFYSYSGSYDSYLRHKAERDMQAESMFTLQQKKIKETENFIERFRYKATKARQVQSRIKQLDKIELIELPESRDEINIRFPSPPPSGIIPLDLKKLSKSFGENVIFHDLDFQITRGEKIAFVGPNGAGKTTLSKIISGKIDFDSGEKILGHNTSISYYAQDVADSLNPELDILETLDNAGGEGKTIGQLRSLLGCFLFSGDDVFKKVGVLSGGEKSRVALAKILLTKANLIVLDEPTNHLDISSKEVLQKALADFTGSLVIVSHDIDFLTPIANKVIEIRKGSFKSYPGGIEYYLEKKKEEESKSSGAADSTSKTENLAKEAVTKKDQKRIEAEMRQKKYAATKDLLKKISNIEKEIDSLETKKAEIENALALPETYSDPAKAKGLNAEYVQVKEKLDIQMENWSELSEKVSEIEQQFTV
jgi:ATP-binding cassette, subfamily F, member 3